MDLSQQKATPKFGFTGSWICNVVFANDNISNKITEVMNYRF